MSALGFKAEFEPPILAGTKILTMRKPRIDGRDPARIGEPLRLYYGMRTKGCRLILPTVCIFRCTLQFEELGTLGIPDVHRGNLCEAAILLAATFLLPRQPAAHDAFARADGFADWAALWAFHSAAGPVEGGCVYREVIGWEPPRHDG